MFSSRLTILYKKYATHIVVLSHIFLKRQTLNLVFGIKISPNGERYIEVCEYSSIW